MDRRDSYDTLYVPFVWVHDGAPQPTEWLARYPEAFWVPAKLVRNRPAAPDIAHQSGSGPAGHSAGQGEPPGDDEFANRGPPPPANPRRRTTAYWLTAQAVDHEDPVMAYLRIIAEVVRAIPEFIALTGGP